MPSQHNPTHQFPPSTLLLVLLLTSPHSSTPIPSNNIPSFSSSSSAPMNLPSTTIIGESALVDRETGQVYWQGGASLHPQISSSMSPLLQNYNLRHLKSTILSSILFLALLSILTSHIRDKLNLFLSNQQALSSSTTATTTSKLHHSILFVIIRIITLCLRVPKFNTWFLVLIIILYFVEAYHCSTRQYLTNSKTLKEMEEYMEYLRRVRPEVTWKVRCFHYEDWDVRKWMGWKKLNDGSKKKKVVTHVATKRYDFASWKDNTIAGVWKRTQSTQLTAPYAKVSLSKILVLQDAKARNEYFKQQSAFVISEGQKDDHAEFSTTIQVDKFLSKILAIRNINGTSQYYHPQNILKFFWICTCLGFTVPFRIWFATHCDEICMTIIKETSSKNLTAVSSTTSTSHGSGSSSSLWIAKKMIPSWGFSWNTSPPPPPPSPPKTEETIEEENEFQKLMRQFDLYEKKNKNMTLDETIQNTTPSAASAALVWNQTQSELENEIRINTNQTVQIVQNGTNQTISNLLVVKE